jgi:FAD/FMN-containing dehydrogenase
MSHNASSPAGQHTGSGSPPPGRRDFLFGSGAIGAAAIAGKLLGAGSLLGSHPAVAHTSARPAWLLSTDTTPSKADWDALRHKLSTGKLYQPGQSGYARAHELFSPQWDSLHPSGVAYCKKDADVAACLSFVTKFKLPVRMRSGGHSYGGWSSVNNGLILDVSEMNSMSFSGDTVTVGTGIDLINFYGGLAAHGKAVPGGSCPTVGIAGLTLGGGVGVLARIYGLTSDNLKSLDVVTADGTTRACNSSKNETLYWASRGGGGGNFGVATSMTFTTHNLRNIVLFFMSWPWSHAGRVVRAWQSWAPHAPDALWSNLHLSAAFGGAPSVTVGGSYVGSVGGAQAQLDKLYHLVGSAPAHPSVVEHSYLSAMLLEAGCASLSVHTCDTPPGGHLPRVPFFAKSDYFAKPINKSGINALLGGIERLRHLRGAAGGAGSIAFDALGGAVNRVHPQATAFVHRNALFGAQYYTGWNWPGSSSGRANQKKWIDSYYKAVHPHADGQAYQNYPDPSLSNYAQAYYGINYPQLQQVKLAYDPHDLFTFPQAIRLPSTSCAAPDC